jgi:periplasmic protein TonB
VSLSDRNDRLLGVRGGHATRWLGAAALTVLAHAAAVWIILNWRSAEVAAPSEPPPAVMIDLSTLISSPQAPQQDVAIGPQMTEAQPAPSDEAAKKTAAAAAPDPSPPAPDKLVDEAAQKPPLAPIRSQQQPTRSETAASNTDAAAEPPPRSPAKAAPLTAPAPNSPTDAELPLPPTLPPEAEAALPPPMELQAPQPSNAPPEALPEPSKGNNAAPVRAISKTELPSPARAGATQANEAKPSVAPPSKVPPPLLDKQRTKAESKRVERTKATKPDDRAEANRTRAPAASNSPAAKSAVSPTSSSGATASSALASWKGELVAHINRFKRFPPNAVAAGTASVAFAINRVGSVVSARLIASSGDRALDEEAVALLHRASPVPPPPAQFGGNVVTLAVPIRFDQ